MKENNKVPQYVVDIDTRKDGYVEMDIYIKIKELGVGR